jgi:hypothetical protein
VFSRSIVRSPERLRVLYRPSATNRVSAEAGMLTSKVLACAVAKGSPNAKSRYIANDVSSLLAELLLPRLTSCLILVHLATSCPKRSRSRRVSR